jgi:hypothetical protein
MIDESPGVSYGYLAMLDEDLRIPAVPWNEGQYYFGHLIELRDAGVLTETEFAAAKARLGSEA